MKLQCFTLLFATIAVLAAAGYRQNAAFAQAQSTSRVPVLAPGIHNQRLPREPEPNVRYSISIPPSYSPSKPVPLVLALHYGGNPNGAGRGVLQILVAPALAELGAIIVAPDSLGGGWNIPENERAVNELLEAVLASYNIDKKKIAVTGFSMGGAGVWHFAGKYPDRFSAAVPVAGRPPASAADWRVPVFAIHSRDDGVVPFGPTETRIAELQKAGLRAELIALNGITHYETDRFVGGLRRAVPWLKEVWK
jgi:predicted peptidase